MKTKVLPILLLLLANFLFAVSTILNKQVLNQVGPFSFLFLVEIWYVILMLLWSMKSQKFSEIQVFFAKKNHKILLFAFCLVVTVSINVFGLKLLPVTTASFLLSFYPLFLGILGVLFANEKCDLGLILGMGIGIVGVAIFYGGVSGLFLGPVLLLPIGAAFGFAILDILAKKIMAQTSAIVVSFFKALVLLCFFTVLLFFSGETLLISRQILLATLTATLLSSVIGFYLYLQAIKNLNCFVFGVICLTSPIFVLILETVFLGRAVSVTELFGGGLILSGGFLNLIKQRMG